MGNQEFMRLTFTVIKPQTLNPHVKVVCAFASELKTVDRCKVISAKIFLDERGASCHFSFKWLHQLQHLRIHLSVGRRHHCWEFKYDKTWIIQRKLILVKSSHGVQTAQGNEELYFQMVNTNFEKKKSVDHYQMEKRRRSLFEHFFTRVLFKRFCSLFNFLLISRRVILEQKCIIIYVLILLWLNESRSMDTIALESLPEII